MESILKTIAKQANLDRVLFTPALKKVYFEMAVASGGATQFKHTESARSGLSYAADKAKSKKQALLFCTAYELIHGYDLMLKIVQEQAPLAVLALRSGTPAEYADIWSSFQLGATGWLQFHTHTLQETYDHLAIAYYLFAEKNIHIPVLVLPSCLKHNALGTYEPRESLNLGSPVSQFGSSSKKKKMSFEEAFASMNKKKEKTTLRSLYDTLIPELRDTYNTFGYQCPEHGLPLYGHLSNGDYAILTAIPEDRNDHEDVLRLLSYRPMKVESISALLNKKKRVAIVEPHPSPGETVGIFYAQICAGLCNRYQGNLIPVWTSPTEKTLDDDQIKTIFRYLEEPKGEEKTYQLE